MGRDAGASEERSHLLPVNALASPLPPVGIDVHQEALRSVGCGVKDWGCEVVGKSSATGHLKKKERSEADGFRPALKCSVTPTGG